MSSQYIFTTYKLARRYPPDREVLSDISLSFLPGAKIGVLGYNGAGKSTVLRIMAGLDTEFDGQAQLAPGASVGTRTYAATSRRVLARPAPCSIASTNSR
jgi:ATPase subunit of ABC transporter with duplicated ATPase domains